MTSDPLHITNGDSAAELIKLAKITGTVLPWRDPMHHGPFLPDSTLQQNSSLRAEYLAGDVLDLNKTKADFNQRDSTLVNAQKYQSVILWFEHDLLDQLQLLQILDQLNQNKNFNKLELICIDKFEGFDNFRGLGQLSPDQLASLYDQRIEVTEDQLRLSSKLWTAFCDPDPRRLLQWTQNADSTLPFMRRALQRHFEEYPWITDGLTRTERQLLSLLSSDQSAAGVLFEKNMALETALYIGDWTTFSIINTLATAATPLINNGDGEYEKWSPATGFQNYVNQKLVLTHAGTQVLYGAVHANTLLERDHWLGGVHISSANTLWQWDSVQQTVCQ